MPRPKETELGPGGQGLPERIPTYEEIRDKFLEEGSISEMELVRSLMAENKIEQIGYTQKLPDGDSVRRFFALTGDTLDVEHPDGKHSVISPFWEQRFLGRIREGRADVVTIRHIQSSERWEQDQDKRGSHRKEVSENITSESDLKEDSVFWRELTYPKATAHMEEEELQELNLETRESRERFLQKLETFIRSKAERLKQEPGR